MLSRALRMLDQRRAGGRPLRVGLIGAGTFGTMTLSQLNRLPGVLIAGVADLDPRRAEAALARAGVGPGPLITGSATELLTLEGLEVVVEATGAPAPGVDHALAAIIWAVTW